MCSMVLKESSSRIRHYSSLDDIEHSWNCDPLTSEEPRVNIPLIPKEDPVSILNPNQSEEDSHNSLRSTGSDDSYHSCNSSLPSKKDKEVFFNMLKHLLEDQGILQEGNEEERCCHKSKLKLKYMGSECKALILDEKGCEIWEGIMKTKCVYLNWRGDEVEPLSVNNLQVVQNELHFLGIKQKKVDDCFSLARTRFTEEQKLVQENTKLKIICGEVILTFGQGNNVATVLYDDNEGMPKYDMKMAHWYTKLYKNLSLFSAWLVTIFRRASSFFSHLATSLQHLCKFLALCSKYKQL